MSAFTVLMVCTANHCRSPIAQQLLSRASSDRFGPTQAWQIASAGTAIPGPWPLHQYAAQVLSERLSSVSDHHSQRLEQASIRQADLILTATRQHRSDVVSTLPAAIGRTFTILQFARLCDQVAPISSDDSGELGRRLVVEAKLARSSLQPVPGEQDDLPDPMGHGLVEFRICADQLQDAVDRILRPLQLET